jgi:hypothetical protein
VAIPALVSPKGYGDSLWLENGWKTAGKWLAKWLATF